MKVPLRHFRERGVQWRNDGRNDDAVDFRGVERRIAQQTQQKDAPLIGSLVADRTQTAVVGENAVVEDSDGQVGISSVKREEHGLLNYRRNHGRREETNVRIAFVSDIHGNRTALDGSVSLSYDGHRRASYLLLDGAEASIRRVEYDVEREIGLLNDSRIPHAGWVARMLVSGPPLLP